MQTNLTLMMKTAELRQKTQETIRKLQYESVGENDVKLLQQTEEKTIESLNECFEENR